MNYHDIEEESTILDDFESSTENHSKFRRPKLIAAVAVLVIFSAATAVYHFGWFSEQAGSSANAASGPPPATVAVAQAQTMTMAPHTVLPGTVVSVRDAVIAAETSGKVLSVSYVGDVIEEGQSLAEIDAKNATQMVAQRRADLDRLKSLYKYHKDYYARVNIDEEKLGIPEIGIAELKSNMETAKADVASAAAALTSAENDLARTSILAPFPGRVVSQSIQQGEYAQIGSPIVRLVDTSTLEVSAQVPAALVQPLAPGTMLEVSGLGKSVLAPLRALVPVGDEVSRTMELRVELKETDFLVGSPVRVSLPSAQPKEVVAIPRDAVILRTNAQYVFVVDDEGKAHRKDVQLGYAQGDMIEVVGDVADLATVVIRGGERLRDGQAVSWVGDANDGTESISRAP